MRTVLKIGAVLTIIRAAAKWEAGGFGMTAFDQASQQILNQFIVPVYSLLLITVVGTVAGGAGFIINQFHTRDIRGKGRA